MAHVRRGIKSTYNPIRDINSRAVSLCRKLTRKARERDRKGEREREAIKIRHFFARISAVIPAIRKSNRFYLFSGWIAIGPTLALNVVCISRLENRTSQPEYFLSAISRSAIKVADGVPGRNEAALRKLRKRDWLP